MLKKTFCLMLAVMLLACSCAFAGEEEAAAYDRFYVTAVIIDEAGNAVLTGTLGAIDLTNEAEPGFFGFGPEDEVSFPLAEGCEIWVPEDVMNAGENTLCGDIAAWFAGADAAQPFYAEFAVDESGALIYLAYIYYPFN